MRYHSQIPALIVLAVGAAHAQVSHIHGKERSRTMQQQEATGSFEVKMQPPPAANDTPTPAGGFTRLSLDKTFQGGLQGTSRVEMLASGGGREASGGYVALERFSGKLEGRSGGFIMQHSGTMSPGSMDISVIVTPGSGTGELEGISGTLIIRQEGKQHVYPFRYALPRRQ